MAAAESYPDDLRYHPEHDWARVDGDEAVLGITWFAQDALGELVHFEAPAAGGTVTKDEAYAEVESVKAVSDVIAPLSGEILEVNEKVVDQPETVNDDPYGDGWLVRIRLTDPSEVGHADGRRRVPRARRRAVSGLPATSRRPTPTARRCSRRSASTRSTSCSSRSPQAVRFDRELDVPPALGEADLMRHLEGLAARNVATDAELSFLGMGIYDHYVPAIVDTFLGRGEFLHRLHAVPAGDEPGRAPGDLRVPDGDLRADRHGRLRMRRGTTAAPWRPTRASSPATTPGARRWCSPRRSTRRCARW